MCKAERCKWLPSLMNLNTHIISSYLNAIYWPTVGLDVNEKTKATLICSKNRNRCHHVFVLALTKLMKSRYYYPSLLEKKTLRNFRHCKFSCKFYKGKSWRTCTDLFNFDHYEKGLWTISKLNKYGAHE